MILHSILQLHTGKGAIVFVYPMGAYPVANLIVYLIEKNTVSDLSGMEGMLIPGITFILAAIWTYFTKDSYHRLGRCIIIFFLTKFIGNDSNDGTKHR